MSDALETVIPESNAEQIVTKLILRTEDLDGSGLVDLFRLLLARAKEHQQILAHSARTAEAMLAGKEPISQETVNAQMLDTVYQTRCLRIFLAQVCRKLADHLEYDLSAKQNKLPRIKCVVFSAEGNVETFRLEPSPP